MPWVGQPLIDFAYPAARPLVTHAPEGERIYGELGTGHSSRC
jgi:hypothetical protein